MLYEVITDQALVLTGPELHDVACRIRKQVHQVVGTCGALRPGDARQHLGQRARVRRLPSFRIRSIDRYLDGVEIFDLERYGADRRAESQQQDIV